MRNSATVITALLVLLALAALLAALKGFGPHGGGTGFSSGG
jgi:hypothetical protein